MKQLPIFLLLVFTAIIPIASCQPSAAKSGDPKMDKLMEQANKMIDALKKHDYKTFVKYTNPYVTKMIGGDEAMIAELEKQKMDFLEATVTKPTKIAGSGNDLYCFVPQKIVVKNNDKGKIIVNSHLLAVSVDGGNNWTFLDASPVTPDNIKEILPSYKGELEIPAKQQPVFEK